MAILHKDGTASLRWTGFHRTTSIPYSFPLFRKGESVNHPGTYEYTDKADRLRQPLTLPFPRTRTVGWPTPLTRPAQGCALCASCCPSSPCLTIPVDHLRRVVSTPRVSIFNAAAIVDRCIVRADPPPGLQHHSRRHRQPWPRLGNVRPLRAHLRSTRTMPYRNASPYASASSNAYRHSVSPPSRTFAAPAHDLTFGRVRGSRFGAVASAVDGSSAGSSSTFVSAPVPTSGSAQGSSTSHRVGYGNAHADAKYGTRDGPSEYSSGHDATTSEGSTAAISVPSRHVPGAETSTESSSAVYKAAFATAHAIYAVFHRLGFEIFFVFALLWRLLCRYIPMLLHKLSASFSASPPAPTPTGTQCNGPAHGFDTTTGSGGARYTAEGGYGGYEALRDEADVDDLL